MPVRRLGFAILILISAASLSAQPLVSGRVVDPSDRPLAGVRVELLPVPSNFEAGRLRLAGRRGPDPVAEARSDAAGRFLLRAPASGAFRVVVRGEGMLPLQYSPLLLVEDEELPPAVLAPEASARFHVTAPSGHPLAAAWVPVEGTEERAAGLEGGAAVRRLRVMSPRGEPAAGVLVRGGSKAWPLGLTDAEGRLQFHWKPGDEARLRLVAEDGRQQIAQLPAQPQELPETVVVLADPAILSGRVTGRTGTQPLAGALVSTRSDPGAFLLTDADGRYRLAVPNVQGLLIEARAPLHLPRAMRLDAGHLKTGRAPTLSLSRAATLRGLVVDLQGAPVPGAGLAAIPDLATAAGAGAPTDLALSRGTTDAAGRFELRRLLPGAFYELRTGKPRYLPAQSKAMAPGPAREGQPLRIVLSPTRSARGRVTDPDGKPVPDAEVRLTPSPRPGERPRRPTRTGPAAENDPAAARTDSRGQFVVAQAPAERVDLEARRRGYAPTAVRGIGIAPGPGAADLGTLVLRPGARITGRVIDRAGKPVAEAAVHLAAGTPFNLLVRAPGHLPAGIRNVRAPLSKPLTVRLDAAALLRGRVISEDGQPVAGASIHFLWEAGVPGRSDRKTGTPVERSAASGRDGRFVLRDLPAGTATLTAIAHGYVAVEGLDVSVPWSDPDRELILTLERGTVLSGRITTAKGDPVSGARVSVAVASAASDDEGAYSVEGAALGPATVDVVHPHYKRVQREMVLEPGGNHLDVTFEAGVEIAGRVVDERGSPVAGARVALRSMALRERQDYQGRTGADGAFRISSVSRGSYRLSAESEGYAPAEAREDLDVAGESLAGLEVVLEAGGAIVGRVLGLKPEELAQVEVEAFSEDAGNIPAVLDAEGRYELRHLRTGDYLIRASLAAGQRQAQARVSLTSREREVRRDLEFTRRLSLSGQVLYGGEPLPETQVSIRGHGLAVERSAMTDHEGSFRFEDLEPDTYWLGLSHTREALVHNETVELPGDRDMVIRLQPATVSGVVRDAESGQSLGGAYVMLRHAAPEFLVSDATMRDGSFRISRVPPGTYEMTVRAEGYSLSERKVAVAAGQDTTDLEVSLTPAGGLDLAVRLASGRIPDLLHVRVVDGRGAPVVAESLQPDPAGAARLSTVPAGSWNLALGAPGGATVTVPVEVPGAPLELALPAAGRLRVRVQGLSSSDLRATLSLSSGDQRFWTLSPGGNVQDQWQLVGGTAVVEGVPAGLWQVRAEAPDGRVWTGTVASSGQNDAEIVLE